MTSTKAGAAWLSVVSNCVLILLKVVAGVLTGSIAILTEAVHSAIDLLASLIALVSIPTVTRRPRTSLPAPRRC